MNAEADTDLRSFEAWFRRCGHRLEFELTGTAGRWAAVVLPADRPMGSDPLLVALGETKRSAAAHAREAFLREPPGMGPYDLKPGERPGG